MRESNQQDKGFQDSISRDPHARDAKAQAFLAAPEAAEAALAQALRQSPTSRDAAWQLAEHAGRLLGLHDCIIYQVEQDELVQVAAWGVKQVAPRLFENPIRLPIGRGIVGACARDGVPVLVCDTELDPRYVIDDEPRRSELAVPIRSGQGLVGVIDSEHPEADFYRSDHIRALLRLAAVFARWSDTRHGKS